MDMTVDRAAYDLAVVRSPRRDGLNTMQSPWDPRPRRNQEPPKCASENDSPLFTQGGWSAGCSSTIFIRSDSFPSNDTR